METNTMPWEAHRSGVWMTQMIIKFGTIEEATAMLPAYTGLDGCVSARVIGGYGKLGDATVGKAPRIQAMFEDCGEGTALPDGCRRVWVPASLIRW